LFRLGKMICASLNSGEDKSLVGTFMDGKLISEGNPRETPTVP